MIKYIPKETIILRILLVEDNKDLCSAIAFAIKKEGYAIDICNDGDDGLRSIRERAHDFILLDRMLPVLDGIDILRIIRKEGIMTPILMVTALGSTENLIEGLDYGADDYIVKPFIMDELLARIRAMSRRPRTLNTLSEISYETMVLDPSKRLLLNESKKVSLSKRECALMEIFMNNIGITLSRPMLLARVWGTDAIVEDGILDNYMTFLRRRLRAVESPLAINTIRGMGFVMEKEPF